MGDKNNEIREDNMQAVDTNEEAGPQTDQTEEANGETGTGEDGLSIEEQLADCRKKNQEYYERLLRSQADFDNYRKRMAREKDEMYSFVTGEIMLSFLGVLDNLERASLAAAGDSGSDSDASFVEGIDMVIKQLKGILSKHGVEEIPAQGEKFDPNFHHAVMQVEDTKQEEGTILEVLQKGYKIKSRVLRPSMVKVAL